MHPHRHLHQKTARLFDIAKRPWITVDAATADPLTTPGLTTRSGRQPPEICDPQEFDA